MTETQDINVTTTTETINVTTEEQTIDVQVGGEEITVVLQAGIAQGSSTNFLELTDTPNSYTGSGGKAVVVKNTEDGLEFNVISTTDEKVKVSSNDTTPGYLNTKLVAGTGINLNVNNTSSNEIFTISATATDPVWGGISGTLSNQTDLQSSLDAKLDSATAASTYLTSATAATTYLKLNQTTSQTISGPITLTQIATPATPSTNTNKLYFKSDDKLYKIDDAGNETEVGASSGGVGGIGFIIDNGTNVVSIGAKTIYVVMDFDCTITGWSISADVIGSIVFDVWKAAGAIPTISDTIISNNTYKPHLTSSQLTVNETDLTSWTTNVSTGDVLAINVDSVSVIKKVNLTINITK